MSDLRGSLWEGAICTLHAYCLVADDFTASSPLDANPSAVAGGGTKISDKRVRVKASEDSYCAGHGAGVNWLVCASFFVSSSSSSSSSSSYLSFFSSSSTSMWIHHQSVTPSGRLRLTVYRTILYQYEITAGDPPPPAINSVLSSISKKVRLTSGTQ